MRLPKAFNACLPGFFEAGCCSPECISALNAPVSAIGKRVLGLCLLVASAVSIAQAKPVSPSAEPILPGSFGPPSEYSVYAPNGQFEAVTNPKRQITTVYRRNGDFRRKQWQFRPPLPVLGLSNDGEYIVTGYGNALPPQISLEQPFLWAYRRSTPVWTVPVSAITNNLAALQCKPGEAFLWGNCQDFAKDDTLLWGSYEGFRNDGRFWIETRDHRRFGFASETGEAKNTDRTQTSASPPE